MTHPVYLKDKARQMRIEKRLTLDEIAERLALPKTIVWYWISYLPIGPTERQSEDARSSSSWSEARNRAGVHPRSAQVQQLTLARRTWRSVHGVLTIRACDTQFRARLQGWMDRIREEWG